MRKSSSVQYAQSAVIPFRFVKKRLEVLLITTRKNGRWIVPKGLVEPDMTPAESAAAEAMEEAGVGGSVSMHPAIRYSYGKWDGVCIVDVYLMKVGRIYDSWLEQDQRHREWLPFEAAAQRVGKEALRGAIVQLPQFIEQAEFVA